MRPLLARSLGDRLTALTWGHALPWKLAIFVLALLATGLAVRIVNRALRGAWWRHARVIEGTTADVDRVKRGQTLLTLLESLVRYVGYGTAVFIGVAWLTGGAGTALFGASFVVVLVGFGLQRLLGDVVAGGLLVFEGHYAIGDVVRVHGPDSAAGIVEEFSLRTTTLRTFSGDRLTVLNGSITDFTRFDRGVRELRVGVHGRGVDAVRERATTAVTRIASWNDLPWLAPPAIESVAPIDGDAPDIARAVIRMVVPPTQEWLAHDLLAAQLRAELGELLVGDVAVIDTDRAAVARWRAGALDQLGQETP